ncbi:GH85 family endohexosaminidase C-terminal domain-containing protein [Streptomyces sp. A5-4]|uniref:GH85 family endohexosaminidase C-terminal domain-containing protein n=1 Tax=Streptomyces sp. A5-4 TaxID=3384771 RepID=UPI003DA9A31E
MRTGDGWTTSSLTLPRGAVHALGVRLTGTGTGTGGAWRLGALSVRGGPATAPGAPTGVRVEAARVLAPGAAELRLHWRATAGARHYEVHQVLTGGGRRFLGGTAGIAYYVPRCAVLRARRSPRSKCAPSASC